MAFPTKYKAYYRWKISMQTNRFSIRDTSSATKLIAELGELKTFSAEIRVFLLFPTFKNPDKC
jgi:hypothetical protein